ncbi:MAG: hypothetical protein J07HN6_01076 [Halonotius sp. J07HN6]|jgi:hypothetical protein|nr:MAG: hypothetical protein J07HN6_01076 [Halonotius sp. J07HN6]
MRSRGVSVLVALCCGLLLVTMPAAAIARSPAVATGASESTASAPGVIQSAPGSIQSSTPAYQTAGSDACFPDSGYRFTIGTLGPQIEMVVHLSLLTNLGAPGTLGVELSGSIDEGDPLIDLKTGAVFHGVTDVGRFLDNPFGVFSIAYDYTFQLPFAGIDYQSDEAPISGPVGESRC